MHGGAQQQQQGNGIFTKLRQYHLAKKGLIALLDLHLKLENRINCVGKRKNTFLLPLQIHTS
jgi:hypothetical protein